MIRLGSRKAYRRSPVVHSESGCDLFRRTYAYCVHLATCLSALAIATSVRSRDLPTACTVANSPGTGTVPRSPLTRLIATIGLDMLTLLGDDVLCHIAKAIVRRAADRH